jgi:hypothetical protein
MTLIEHLSAQMPWLLTDAPEVYWDNSAASERASVERDYASRAISGDLWMEPDAGVRSDGEEIFCSREGRYVIRYYDAARYESQL